MNSNAGLGLDIPKRVAVACANCRERKIKCITESKEKACLRCHFNGMQCTYLATEKQRERAVVKARLSLAKGTTGARRRGVKRVASSLVSSPSPDTITCKRERNISPRPTPYPRPTPTPRISVSQPVSQSASPRIGFKIELGPRDLLDADLDLDAGFSGPAPRLSAHFHTRVSAPASPNYPHPIDIALPAADYGFGQQTLSYSQPSPTLSSSSSSTGSSASYPTPPSSAGVSAMSFDAVFDPSFALPQPVAGCYQHQSQTHSPTSGFAEDFVAYNFAFSQHQQLPTPADSPVLYAPGYAAY
ncbi:Zn(2)-C6 fungal-type domain-containing protein [Mycena chlorophos]|uniref:Zn(2)-C6 fungal-type domain-containing protein n=1 Tax=Mycena chlorophos TaxID=658473 RepID=A0A8H6TK68_MYCCL|nr:Zn(2)-C6 fungal-type domain-containing protein [Mycena chlorophos]